MDRLHRCARVALAVTALGVGALLLFARLSCSDVWFHLRAGEWLLGGGGFPSADPFSFTADQRWIDTSWLFQLPLALAHRVAGLAGVTWLNALMIGLAFGGVAWMTRRRGLRTADRAALLALALLACSPRLFPRPESLSLVYLALALWLTEEALAGRVRRLGGFLPLQLAWVNTETLFPLGLAVLAAGFLEALRRRHLTTAALRHWALALGGGLAASWANPHGTRGALLPLRMAQQVADPSDIFHRGVYELKSAFDPAMPPGSVVFFFLFALAVLALAVRGRRRLDAFAILVLLGFGYLAVSSVRNIPLFALAGSFVALRSSAAPDAPAGARPPLGAAIARGALAAALAFAGVGILTSGFYATLGLGKRFGVGLDDRVFPTASLAALRREGPPPRVMNDHGLGHYLIWELRPGTRVFIDGRSEVYRPGTIAEMMPAFARADAFDALADRYGVRDAVLGHRSEYLEPLLTGLASHPRWRVAGVDAGGVRFRRDPEAAQPFEPEPPPSEPLPPPRARSWLARWFAPAGRDVADRETAVARGLLLVGQPGGAAAHALRAVRAAPWSADAYNQLGAAYARLGRFDEAREALLACLELDPRYAEALLNLGASEIAARRPAEAEGWLRRALAAGAPPGSARLQLARSLAAQSRPEEAGVEYAVAARLLPADPRPCLELASLTYRQNRFREAAVLYLEGARRGEAFRGLWGAGVSYWAAKSQREAREVLVQALDVAPDTASAARVQELLRELGANGGQ
jgi:Flp pilus assembly protein TadD